jgi:hypothetical protein
MQDDERAIEGLVQQALQHVRVRVHRVGIHPPAQQGLQHGRPAFQGNLPLGRLAAQ